MTYTMMDKVMILVLITGLVLSTLFFYMCTTQDPLFKIPSSDIILIQKHPNNSAPTFVLTINESVDIGRVYMKDGQLHFLGQLDRSAEMLFDAANFLHKNEGVSNVSE